ncbi:OTU domain-containing protein [Aphelenchoides besseyi]|nr:OTU domain-containing protein [Aphelenchoides besseyi]
MPQPDRLLPMSNGYNGAGRHGPTPSDTDDHSSTCSSLNRKALRPPAYTFILPNFGQFSEDFRHYIERELIEVATLKRLEASGHLNWWCTHANQRLWPLLTTGDGNCLLHAISLAIWGVHDRQLNLRQMLHDALTVSERRPAFYRRWRYYETKSNLQSQLVLTEDEWQKEWATISALASLTPRVFGSENGSSSKSDDTIYQSLEILHVYVLANILKRPIIIVSDTILRNANGEELSPIPFGGIFLPLQVEPHQCQRSPLILCYDASHFSPLVGMHETSSNWLQAIPITYKNRELLPVHFAVDPGPNFNWWKDAEDQRVANELDAQQTDDRHLELIGRYMDIVKMDLRRGSVKKTTPLTNGGEFTPSAPIKMLTLASGNEPPSNGHGSRIMSEIRQHFRWLGRRSKRKQNRPTFSAEELRQKNSLLCVLLHHFSHVHVKPMLATYISDARERFERSKMGPCGPPPKNRMSRSFSSSSVLLTCLNSQCNRIASPSTNFLCSLCFDEQKREMVSIGSTSANNSPNSTGSQKENKPTPARRHPSTRQEFACSKSSTMPEIKPLVNQRGVPIYNSAAYADEIPFRYADSTSGTSSTVSSRNGARQIPSPSTMTSYFYEADEGREDEITLANRLNRTRIEIDAPYSRSAPYHYAPIIHQSNVIPVQRIRSPTYASHSLPRVQVDMSKVHYNYEPEPLELPKMTAPNVVKTCSNGINRKVSSNGGVSFYYAAPT